MSAYPRLISCLESEDSNLLILKNQHGQLKAPAFQELMAGCWSVLL